jgi:hypothetical protein
VKLGLDVDATNNNLEHPVEQSLRRLSPAQKFQEANTLLRDRLLRERRAYLESNRASAVNVTAHKYIFLIFYPNIIYQ